MLRLKLIPVVIWLMLHSSRVASLRVRNSCECGVGKEEVIETRIINGQDVPPHAFPWVVYLTYGAVTFCGGAILNDLFILTAGHCVYSLNADKMLVYVGASDLKTDKGQPMEIQQYILHPQFKTYNDYDENDIALIRLKKRLKFNDNIKPICLPEKDDYTGMVAVISGFGVTERNTTSRKLLNSKVRILANDVCSKAKYIGQYFNPKQSMCAYGHKTDTCQGDSGSSLIFEERPYKYHVVGIVSWGYGCAPEGVPGVYATVSNNIPWLTQESKDGIFCKN